MVENGFNPYQLSFHTSLKDRVQTTATLADAQSIICASLDNARQLGYRVAFLSGPVTPRSALETRRGNLLALAAQTQEVASFLLGEGIVVFSCDILDDLIDRVDNREDAYRFWNRIVRGDEHHAGVDMLIVARGAQGSRGVLEEIAVASERGIPIMAMNDQGSWDIISI